MMCKKLPFLARAWIIVVYACASGTPLLLSNAALVRQNILIV